MGAGGARGGARGLEKVAAEPPDASLEEKKEKRRRGKEEIEIAGRGGHAEGGGLTQRPYYGEKGHFLACFARQLLSAQKQRQRGLFGSPRAGSMG